jgi:hypothetical protein
MSRGIPKVRTWLVRAYDDHGALVGEHKIQTINRRFAKWLTRDARAWYGLQLTASVVRG